MHDLVRVCIHFCNVSWFQVVNTTDVGCGLIQKVSTDTNLVLLCLIRLSGYRFL